MSENPTSGQPLSTAIGGTSAPPRGRSRTASAGAAALCALGFTCQLLAFEPLFAAPNEGPRRVPRPLEPRPPAPDERPEPASAAASEGLRSDLSDTADSSDMPVPRETTEMSDEEPAEPSASPRRDPFLEVPFPFGSARPPPRFPEETLERFVRIALECPERPVVVEGHADAAGSSKWNLQLSWLRARAMGRRLREAGIPQERLTIRGLGAYAPKVDHTNDSAAQRRVEIRVPGCTEEATR